MSVFRDRVIVCPRCGDRATRHIALSINGSRRPDVCRAIVDDRFQRYECAACQRGYVVDSPFAFLDFDARLWIGVFPAAWESSWRALEREPLESFELNMVELAPPMVQTMARGFMVRTVFGLAALRDKLVCFGAGLDDHGLEVLKLDLLRATPGLSFHPRGRLSLKRVSDDKLVFTGHAPDEKSAGAANDAEEYERGRDPGDAVAWRPIELTIGRDRLARILSDDSGWALTWQSVTGGPYVDTGRVMLAGDAPRPRPA